MAVVAAVREAVGNAVDLLIEGHGRFNVPTACTIARELEPFRPLFFEEPVPPDNLDALADVRAKPRPLRHYVGTLTDIRPPRQSHISDPGGRYRQRIEGGSE
jgi:L-alanine-DL-glutamate epimerase-like enolase superfamily enzyme